MPNPLPSVSQVTDMFEVASLKGALVLGGMGIVAGAALAVARFYAVPALQRLRMRVAPAA